MNQNELCRQVRVSQDEEYQELLGNDVYQAIMNAKEGMIKVEKVSDNPSKYGINQGYTASGYTASFGEGISLYITSPTHWFHTSVIKKINWEDHTFQTENSTYRFDFKESSNSDENGNN